MLVALVADPALAGGDPPALTEDGLELVKNDRLDPVYRRPGVNFSAYSKIMLDNMEAAFKKPWTIRADDRADARIKLKKWAIALRDGLDEARGIER